MRSSKRRQRGWVEWIPAAISAASAIMGKLGQDSANEQNKEQAELNRDFQERMSSTSYQRAVNDMSAAGLNPMLAYSQGGASTPGGSSTAPIQNSLGAGMSSAAQAAATAQGLENARVNNENVQANTAKTISETVDQKLNTAMMVARIEDTRGSAANRESAGPGIEADSVTKQAVLDAMMKGDSPGPGFKADYERRVAESRKAISDARKTAAEARGAEYDLGKKRVYSDFYGENAGRAEPYLDQLLRGLDSGSSALSKWLPWGRIGRIFGGKP